MNETLSPKFITFDMMGTLIKLEWTAEATALVADRLSPDDAEKFVVTFRNHRENEIIGTYRDYPVIIRDAWQYSCNDWRIEFRQSDVDRLMDALVSWGPHDDVVEPLKRLAAKYPLVVLTNHCDALVRRNSDRLGVELHRVFTAEQAQAYKPHKAAFKYLFDQLNAGPADILHVSAHLWHDWIPAAQLGVENQAYIERGFDPLITAPTAYTDTLAGVADRVGA